jgi:hypothetical protein
MSRGNEIRLVQRTSRTLFLLVDESCGNTDIVEPALFQTVLVMPNTALAVGSPVALVEHDVGLVEESPEGVQ